MSVVGVKSVKTTGPIKSLAEEEDAAVLADVVKLKFNDFFIHFTYF